jgi:dihydrolipoamide dehydrogenase
MIVVPIFYGMLRVYLLKGNQIMKYNCIVIGSGPAGFYSALSCAKKGYKTAIIENSRLGGTGFRTGCLPVKRNLDVLRKVEEAVQIAPELIQGDLKSRKKLLINTENYMDNTVELMTKRLTDKSIDIYKGDGEFHDSNTFIINNRKLKTNYFIIASGTSPNSIPGISLNRKNIISHVEALRLNEIPDKMIIIGGNVEGLEFAAIFAYMGVDVTVIEQLDNLLDGTDKDLAKPVLDKLKSLNVTFKTGLKVVSAEERGNSLIIRLDTEEIIETSMVLLTGIRQMNIPDGIEKTGVNYSSLGIPVNSCLQTNVANIFAAGDINGIHGMAHIAIQQGMLITEGLKGRPVVRDYKSLPRAIFTMPEIAGAGIQEWELEGKNTPYKVKTYPLKDTWRGFSRNYKTGFIKLIFDNSHILKGIWMTGSDASEILSSSGFLIGKNLSDSEILSNLFIHPTIGEGILEAVFT